MKRHDNASHARRRVGNHSASCRWLGVALCTLAIVYGEIIMMVVVHPTCDDLSATQDELRALRVTDSLACAETILSLVRSLVAVCARGLCSQWCVVRFTRR